MGAMDTLTRDATTRDDVRHRRTAVGLALAAAATLALGAWLVFGPATDDASATARSDVEAWLAADWTTVEALRDDRAFMRLAERIEHSFELPADAPRPYAYFETLAVFDPAIRSFDCAPLTSAETERAGEKLLSFSNWWRPMEVQGVSCSLAVTSQLHDSVGAVAWWEVTELITGDGQILATSFDNSEPEVREGTGATGAYEVLGALHRFAADQPGYAAACRESSSSPAEARRTRSPQVRAPRPPARPSRARRSRSADTTCGDFLAGHLDGFVDAYVPFSLDATADQVSAGSPPAVVVAAVEAIARGDAATAAATAIPAPFYDGWLVSLPSDALDASGLGVAPAVHSCRSSDLSEWWASTTYIPTWQGKSITVDCVVTVPAGDHRLRATVTDGLISDLMIAADTSP